MQLDEATKTKLDKELSKTKIVLLSTKDMVFFSTVCLNLIHRFDKVGTACTNGNYIKYDPAFWGICTPGQRVGLMLHETLHVVFNHMSRLKDRNHKRWNVACDYVINLIIVNNYIELPPGGLLDYKYENMSADQVYELLEPEDYENAPDHLIPPSTDQEAEEIKEQIDSVLIQADIQSRMAGGNNIDKIPGEIQFYINKLLKPRLKLGPRLRRYFNGFARKDYSYAKINRRYHKFKFPTLHSPAMGEVAAAVDASMSVSDDEFDRIVGEVGGIIQQTKPTKLSLVSFDTAIRTETEITKLYELGRVEFRGRGGTSIAPVMEWGNKHMPKVLVVFSDGHFYFTENTPMPKCPVLWLIYDNDDFKVPNHKWGKVIHFNMEDL